jgi:aminomethyltransferase
MMRTALYDEHLRLGAKMTQFAGWEMPLYYAGIVREVEAVRSTAGIFDLSHMGEFMVSGPPALDLIQLVTTNDASRLEVGDAQYTLMCNENGGVIDDLIVYRLDSDLYMPVVNASNIASDFEWVQGHNTMVADCRNRSHETGLVAVQGPAALRLLQPILNLDLDSIRRFTIKKGRVGDIEAWIARTGYTGEDGFEIYCSASDSLPVWRLVMKQGEDFGAQPVGLAARDVLRTEAGYPLYGNELTTQTSPVEARLMWAVKPEKGEFIGREAILEVKEQGPRQLLTGLTSVDRCIPRHEQVVTANGAAVGMVTSGTFSPTLGKGIAIAYVEPDYAVEGVRLEVQIRDKPCPFDAVRLPLYRSKSLAPAAVKS